MDKLGRTKNIIYILLGIIVLGLIGFMLWRFLAPPARKTPPERVRVTGRLTPGRTLAPAEEKSALELKPGEELLVAPGQKLYRLTDFSVVSPSLNKEENRILFYKKDGGDLLASSFTGNVQDKISNITIVGMLEAVWSPLKDRAVVVYFDQDVLKSFIHTGTSSIIVLPPGTKRFSWAPDGKSLAYLLLKENRLQLVVADSAGRNPRTILTLPPLDVIPQWITGDKISLATTPSGVAEGFVIVYSRKSGTLERVVGPLFGLMSRGAPDGSKVLVSSTDRAGKHLRLTAHDASKKEVFATDLETLAEKCVWADTKEIYCAVPRTVPAESVLPDAYLRGEMHTDDRLVVINLDRKETEELFNQENFNMSDLILTKNKEYLFFINRTDGTLWSLKLK